LANMAAMYGVYHGPDGLKAIAERVHELTRVLERELAAIGVNQTNPAYFDTLRLEPPSRAEAGRRAGLEAGINFRYVDERTVGISLNETVTTGDVQDIANVFAKAVGIPGPKGRGLHSPQRDRGGGVLLPPPLGRTSGFMTHPVFNTHKSETQMMRYIRSLERKDIGLDTSMIPLG